jgi:EAL domain-containing protein (putative c-di-GMP-specific phosphodiesterase class I)
VIAEDVETAEQLAQLASQQAQGYYLARPVLVADAHRRQIG